VLTRVGLPAFLDARGALSCAEVGAPLEQPIGAVAFAHLAAGGELGVRAAFVVALRGAVRVHGGSCAADADEPGVGVRVAPEGHVRLASADEAVVLLIGSAPVADPPSAGAPVQGTTIDDCHRVPLPVARAPGTLTVPAAAHFPVRRVYWIHGVKAGAGRGSHAHRALWQSFHAPSGAFDLHVNDGCRRATYHLADPAVCVVVPPMLWRDLDGFSEDAVCAVLASELYDPTDYVRDYAAFRALKEPG
jgi:hypothetical protein